MLILTPISPRQIVVDNELFLNYDNPGDNLPERVGVVTGFVGQIAEGTYCVQMFTYNLRDKESGRTVSGYRSYRIDGLRSLYRIDWVATLPPPTNTLDDIRRAVARLKGKLIS